MIVFVPIHIATSAYLIYPYIKYLIFRLSYNNHSMAWKVFRFTWSKQMQLSHLLKFEIFHFEVCVCTCVHMHVHFKYFLCSLSLKLLYSEISSHSWNGYLFWLMLSRTQQDSLRTLLCPRSFIHLIKKHLLSATIWQVLV